MKEQIITLTFMVILFLSFAPEQIFAETSSAIDIQRSLMQKGATRQVEIEIEMRVAIPYYSGLDPIVFNKYSIVPFSKSGNTIVVKGENIPKLFTKLTQVPEAMRPVTMIVSGVRGNKTRFSERKDGSYEVKNLKLDVEIYGSEYYEINDSTQAAVKLRLDEIGVTRAEFDEEGPSLSMEFSSILPTIENDLFDTYVAGKEVIGKISIDFLDVVR